MENDQDDEREVLEKDRRGGVGDEKMECQRLQKLKLQGLVLWVVEGQKMEDKRGGGVGGQWYLAVLSGMAQGPGVPLGTLPQLEAWASAERQRQKSFGVTQE